MINCRCSACNKSVRSNSRAIECGVCTLWYHQKCSGLATKDINNFTRTGDFWICGNCTSSIFPFYNLSISEIVSLSFNSNTECFCSKHINNRSLESLPFFDLYSQISKSHGLTDVDVDGQIPSQTNFNYYSAHDVHSSAEIQMLKSGKSFSAIHCNTRSLSSNLDSLNELLSDMDHHFSIIGISETKLSKDVAPVSNIDIPGYQFFHQDSLSNAGGVGVYIDDTLSFISL
jgi:hypothetical protein